MRILSQNKEKVINMPRSMWVNEIEGKGLIMSNTLYAPIIGSYPNKDRAKEVLNSVYGAFKTGAKVFELPEA